MAFYDVRIPFKQRAELLALVNKVKGFIADRGTSGYFADNLITIGRNLGFMHDDSFRKSLDSSFIEPDDVNKTWRLHVYAWAVRSALEVEGDLVECGVYRGLYVDAAVKYLFEIIKDKEFYLYDTFEGLDKRYSSDVERVLTGDSSYNKSGLENEVRERFSKYNWINVIKGVIPDILHDHSPKKISFLHLDLNAGIAETKALDILFDRISEGGIILLDDYGRFEHNDLFCDHNRWFINKGYRILELPTGQGLVIKRNIKDLKQKVKCADFGPRNITPLLSTPKGENPLGTLEIRS